MAKRLMRWQCIIHPVVNCWLVCARLGGRVCRCGTTCCSRPGTNRLTGRRRTNGFCVRATSFRTSSPITTTTLGAVRFRITSECTVIANGFSFGGWEDGFDMGWGHQCVRTVWSLACSIRLLLAARTRSHALRQLKRQTQLNRVHGVNIYSYFSGRFVRRRPARPQPVGYLRSHNARMRIYLRFGYVYAKHVWRVSGVCAPRSVRVCAVFWVPSAKGMFRIGTRKHTHAHTDTRTRVASHGGIFVCL